MESRERGRRLRGERGVALVEFALVFPIFMMIVLGMFSGGQAYDRKNSITNATGEASRYGATLAPSPLVPSPPAACYAPGQVSWCGVDEWVYAVAAAVIQNADGDLDASTAGRRICVAYRHPAADAATLPVHAEVSHMIVLTASDATASVETSGATAKCFDDGRPDSERRVQISVERKSPLNGLFFRMDLTLRARSVTRFEATSY